MDNVPTLSSNVFYNFLVDGFLFQTCFLSDNCKVFRIVAIFGKSHPVLLGFSEDRFHLIISDYNFPKDVKPHETP